MSANLSGFFFDEDPQNFQSMCDAVVQHLTSTPAHLSAGAEAWKCEADLSIWLSPQAIRLCPGLPRPRFWDQPEPSPGWVRLFPR